MQNFPITIGHNQRWDEELYNQKGNSIQQLHPWTLRPICFHAKLWWANDSFDANQLTSPQNVTFLKAITFSSCTMNNGEDTTTQRAQQRICKRMGFWSQFYFYCQPSTIVPLVRSKALSVGSQWNGNDQRQLGRGNKRKWALNYVERICI